MDGEFVGKKRLILPIIYLVCGLFFIGTAIAMNTAAPAVDTGWIFRLIFGCVCTIAAVALLLFNRNAFLHIGEDNIIARYHWFGRLECSIDDVAFILSQTNTLRIRLKSGKQHMITGICNSWHAAALVRRQRFALETDPPDSLRRQLEQIQKARKKELRWVIGLGVLMFVNVFIAVLLTGARDMADFTDSDRTCFTVMSIIEAITVLGCFYAASRAGNYLMPIEETKYRLRGAVIASHPLPADNVVGVYTDENYLRRIVVCGCPNDDSVYYNIEQFTEDFTLQIEMSWAVYKNMEELFVEEEIFSYSIDITSDIVSL